MHMYAPPRLGGAWHDVFQTSPGRTDPRTGLLVQRTSFKPVAPWERAEREIRDAEKKLEELKSRSSAYPRMRRDYAETMSGQLGRHETSSIFSNAIPWVFLGVAALVALEATGVTRLSAQKVG